MQGYELEPIPRGEFLGKLVRFLDLKSEEIRKSTEDNVRRERVAKEEAIILFFVQRLMFAPREKVDSIFDNYSLITDFLESK
ncbi:MAG: hypothetical protein AAB688_02320 [Patescibacteria group bacterium]